jgi:hypothetical protein
MIGFEIKELVKREMEKIVEEVAADIIVQEWQLIALLYPDAPFRLPIKLKCS